MNDWLIYGANGYTGRLIARLAKERGLRPTLAGRSAQPVERLASELGLEARVFDLSADALPANLRGMRLVLNCAGPFVRTAPAMLAGCLAAGSHYLDITGEIEVIEQAAALDAAARQSGVTLMPAVGFDVVPSDCLAKALAQHLPGATRLALA
ncbi:MAG TPA: saccharopine dehydrogenase NADP-binding domain-containing protein, partial [Pirellulales bacterium]